MTQRLGEAFRAASRLPPADRDALAESILAGVERGPSPGPGRMPAGGAPGI